MAAIGTVVSMGSVSFVSWVSRNVEIVDFPPHAALEAQGVQFLESGTVSAGAGVAVRGR